MVRTLQQQWEIEREIWPEGPGFSAFARRVAARPWIFGRGARGAFRPLIKEARALVIALDGPAPSRWELLEKTSPSGKALFRCRGCGTESPVARVCRERCKDEAVAWGWE